MASEEYLQMLEEAFPFKTLRVPQNLLDRYNSEFGNTYEVRQMSITVGGDFNPTEGELWEVILKLKEATKDAKPIKPPFIGVKKTKLI